MNLARIALFGAVLATGAAVYGKPVKGPGAPSAQDIVNARQAGMAMSVSTLTLLKNASGNGVPLKNLAFPAGGLAKWATSLPTLFSENTKGVPSRAKPTVWTDRAGFSAKAADFASAAQALAKAAAAEDKAGFDAALASVGASCKGCHDSYQLPPPAKPG